MSYSITGIPQAVTSGQLDQMLATIGLTSREVKNVNITPTLIEAEVFVLDADGNRCHTNVRRGLTHILRIAVNPGPLDVGGPVMRAVDGEPSLHAADGELS